MHIVLRKERSWAAPWLNLLLGNLSLGFAQTPFGVVANAILLGTTVLLVALSLRTEPVRYRRALILAGPALAMMGLAVSLIAT